MSLMNYMLPSLLFAFVLTSSISKRHSTSHTTHHLPEETRSRLSGKYLLTIPYILKQKHLKNNASQGPDMALVVYG